MSGDAARAKLLDLIASVVPTDEPSKRFVAVSRAKGSGHRLEETAVTRAFDLTEGDVQDYGLTYSTTPLWTCTAEIRVRYETRGGPSDWERWARVGAKDCRAIVRRLQIASDWGASLMDLHVTGAAYRIDFDVGDGPTPQFSIWSIPIQFRFVE